MGEEDVETTPEWLLEKGHHDAEALNPWTELIRTLDPSASVYLTGYACGILEGLLDRGIEMKVLEELLEDLQEREEDIKRRAGTDFDEAFVEEGVAPADIVRAIHERPKAEFKTASEAVGSLYMLLYRWTPQRKREILEGYGGGLTRTVERFVEFVGPRYNVRLVAAYVVTGRWDVLVVLEAPDAQSVKAVETFGSAAENFEEVTTIPLISFPQYAAALRSAHREEPEEAAR